MTNLSDFFKVKKVRCVQPCGGCLTAGKEYSVLDIRMEIKVKDDEDEDCYWESDRFEPVLEPVVNQLQEMKLTPEFGAEKSKFKVGDKVYLFGTDYIEEITKIIGANVYLAGADFDASVSVKEICHATPENYERLQAIFPDIEFEKPHKPLSGDALVKAMLAKGIKNVLCLWGNGDKIIIDQLSYNGGLMSTNCNIVGGLTPIDWYTGEPLTESVLND